MKKVIYILLLFLTSCVTYNRCMDKYGAMQGDTVRVPVLVKVPYKITVPPDSSSMRLMLDSLFRLKIGQKYTVAPKDSSGIALQYWRDSTGLNVKAKQPGRIIHDTVQVFDTIKCPPAKVLVKPRTKVQLLWDTYCPYAGVLLPIIILLIIYLKRK